MIDLIKNSEYVKLYNAYSTLQSEKDNFWLNANTSGNYERTHTSSNFTESKMGEIVVFTIAFFKGNKKELEEFLSDSLKEATDKLDFIKIKYLLAVLESIEIETFSLLTKVFEGLVHKFIYLYNTNHNTISSHIYILEQVVSLLQDYPCVELVKTYLSLCNIKLRNSSYHSDMVNCIIKSMQILFELGYYDFIQTLANHENGSIREETTFLVPSST